MHANQQQQNERNPERKKKEIGNPKCDGLNVGSNEEVKALRVKVLLLLLPIPYSAANDASGITMGGMICLRRRQQYSHSIKDIQVHIITYVV